jgi:hypothetical protein
MTRTADRAKNIRRLTIAEREALDIRGGIVDTAVPTAATALVEKYAPGRLDAFGELLGRYRLFADDKEPPPARQAQLLDELLDCLDELRARLDMLPSLVDARASDVSWGLHRVQLHDEIRDTDARLSRLRQYFSGAADTVAALKGWRGDKTDWARDGLLRETLLLLPPGMKKQTAAKAAQDILKACGLTTPDDPKSLERLARKVSKNHA